MVQVAVLNAFTSGAGMVDAGATAASGELGADAGNIARA